VRNLKQKSYDGWETARATWIDEGNSRMMKDYISSWHPAFFIFYFVVDKKPSLYLLLKARIRFRFSPFAPAPGFCIGPVIWLGLFVFAQALVCLVNLPLDLLLLVWGYGLQSMNLLGK
jgi:hypothetical protein